MSAGGRRDAAYARVVAPTVVDETGRPVVHDPVLAMPWASTNGLQQVGALIRRARLTDAASPRLRESAATLLVIVRALCLFGITAAASVTAVIVLARLWGWLL